MVLFSPKDEARQQPRLTVNGRMQPEPEGPGTVQRRYRLFIEALRRTIDHPLASAPLHGVPIGDGLGMEDVVARVAPLFEREAALARWVALRGALTALHVHTVDASSRAVPFYPVVENVMGVGHVGDVSRGDDRIDVAPQYAGGMPPDQKQAAIGVFAALSVRLFNYEQYAAMNVDSVLASPFNVSQAVALDFIAWTAIALHRLKLSGELMANVPEPDALQQPGWYADPLWGKAERHWDGRDWSTRVRIVQGRGYAYGDGAI